MTPLDAALDVLRNQSPGRPTPVKQIADTAVRRRLVHGEPGEAWRVVRAALAAEPKERLRNGLRPRTRAAGNGTFSLSRRPVNAELEKAEQVFGDARRALAERTVAEMERRLRDLSSANFEALVRILLVEQGFGPPSFVKRVEDTAYFEVLRGRGSRPSRCLVSVRPGPAAVGRRSVGELRAGIDARKQDEGLLLTAARLSEEAVDEWRKSGPPLEIVDGAAMAESCVRHGVGTVSATVPVSFVDADFFAELSEK